jgi:hypothetical protein
VESMNVNPPKGVWKIREIVGIHRGMPLVIEWPEAFNREANAERAIANSGLQGFVPEMPSQPTLKAVFLYDGKES